MIAVTQANAEIALHSKRFRLLGIHQQRGDRERDVQIAPLSIPDLRIGENQSIYSDESPGIRHVRITHRWVKGLAGVNRVNLVYESPFFAGNFRES